MTVHFLHTTDMSQVVIRCKTKDLGDFDFVRTGTSKTEVRLLRRELETLFNGQIEDIRRVSYLRGWKHAKSKKRAKGNWFSCHEEVLDWERKEAGL